MLKLIKVSGFKSLEDFEFEFQRGLNVIIGPNGSGKTNIINFIEFLSFLARSNLLTAVSRSGGAGRIFRRDKNGNLDRKITFTIFGEGRYKDFRRQKEEWTQYEYSAEISLSDNNSTIYYSNQRLKMSVDLMPEEDDLPNFFEARTPNSFEWPLDIEVLSDETEYISVKFHGGDERYIYDRFGPKGKSDVGQIKEIIVKSAQEDANSAAIFQIFDQYLRNCRFIASDLWGAKSFNIAPAVVRTPEDIASEPEISEDGGGLAATLFALQNAKSIDHSRMYSYYHGPYFDHPEQTMNKILSYSRLVNDSILKVEVEPDTIENKLRIFVYVDYFDSILRLPFSLVSDGTAKWFALITAIMTSPSVFAIEEPENYLHPLMQKEIVKIVRNTFSSADIDGFAVMTTHSETILNCVDPDEMVLVRMSDGRTLAKRPVNSADIREEIARTGFGAGYYYLAGAIE